MRSETPPPVQAKILPSGPYKRAHERFLLQLEVEVRILIPEETFTPVSMKGKTFDVSARGMKVGLEYLPGSVYQQLMRDCRYVRVEIPISANQEPIKLVGRVMWLDYHKSEANGHGGRCFLGVSFGEDNGNMLNAYEALVRELLGTPEE